MHDDDSRARFGMRFSLVARRWRQVLELYLADAGLTDATWAPLVHLHESGGGITQKALAARVGIDGSSLVRLLDILSRQGLVERRADETDGRARLVFLTPAGLKRVQDIRQALIRGEQDMLESLREGEIETMLEQFERLDQRLLTIQEQRSAAKGRRS